MRIKFEGEAFGEEGCVMREGGSYYVEGTGCEGGMLSECSHRGLS